MPHFCGSWEGKQPHSYSNPTTTKWHILHRSHRRRHGGGGGGGPPPPPPTPPPPLWKKGGWSPHVSNVYTFQYAIHTTMRPQSYHQKASETLWELKIPGGACPQTPPTPTLVDHSPPLDLWRGSYITCSLVPRHQPLQGKRVWHSSSHSLVLLTLQFRILNYQSDLRHVIFHVTLASAIFLYMHNVTTSCSRSCARTEIQAQNVEEANRQCIAINLSLSLEEGLGMQCRDKKRVVLFWWYLLLLHQFKNLRLKYIGKS